MDVHEHLRTPADETSRVRAPDAAFDALHLPLFTPKMDECSTLNHQPRVSRPSLKAGRNELGSHLPVTLSRQSRSKPECASVRWRCATSTQQPEKPRSCPRRAGPRWHPSALHVRSGRVDSDGSPVDPDSYDYRRAARDAIHFPKLMDRFWQNLCRAVGWNCQYFAVLEPQRRLAPHLHAAIRGTVPRAVLRQVAAATFHQVWWPPCDRPVYSSDHIPLWDDTRGGYTDPDSGALLTTWDDALDAIGPGDTPAHVVRFGVQVRADGVTANSRTTNRMIGYLCKYLAKSLDACHTTTSDRQRTHVDQLADALRYEPCSPTCSNWLLFAVQPNNARPGLSPGRCTGKAHRRETLGFGGRRVLVSRQWSGKSLADHRNDRKTWVRTLLTTLSIPVATLYQWRHRRIGPPVYRVGRWLRYDPADIRQWLSAQKAA